jgi:acetyl esterase/lipase
MQTPFVKQTLSSIPGPDCSTQERMIRSGSSGIDIPVRIYTPGSRPTGRPVIIMSHQGGFCTGDLNSEEFICRLLCRSIGMIVIDVAYRLVPEHKLQDSRDDVYNVVEWTSKNATSIGGDLSKGFLIGGVSAGGLHSQNALYRARDENLQPPITGVFIACTGVPTELQDATRSWSFLPEKLPSAKQNEFAPFSEKATNLCYGELADARVDDPEITVLYRADHSKLPPLYYQTAGMDLFRDGALYFQHLYRQAGNKCRTEIYPGVPHLWWLFYSQLSVTKKWANDVVSGVQWVLQQGQKDVLKSQL